MIGYSTKMFTFLFQLDQFYHHTVLEKRSQDSCAAPSGTGMFTWIIFIWSDGKLVTLISGFHHKTVPTVRMLCAGRWTLCEPCLKAAFTFPQCACFNVSESKAHWLRWKLVFAQCDPTLLHFIHWLYYYKDKHMHSAAHLVHRNIWWLGYNLGFQLKEEKCVV